MAGGRENKLNNRGWWQSKPSYSPIRSVPHQWSHASTPTCVYMGWCLIKHKVNFLFVFVNVPVTPTVFWDVTPYSLVEAYRYFGETCGLSRRCRRVYSSSFCRVIAARTSHLTKLSIVRVRHNCVSFISVYLLTNKNLFDPFNYAESVITRFYSLLT